MPAGGVLAEILGGGFRPRPLDGVQPLQVERQGRVVGGNGVDQGARQPGEGAALPQPIKGPGALPEAVEQSGVAQQLEMAGNTRLALTQNLVNSLTVSSPWAHRASSRNRVGSAAAFSAVSRKSIPVP